MLLQHICSLHNIDCPFLQLYNKKRDSQLELIMKSEKLTAKQAKQEMLALVNTEHQQRKLQNPFVIEFDNEMKDIQQELRKIKEYAVMLKDANTEKNNQTGSFINLVLCKYENEVLQTIVGVCKQKDIEICTLMFDGLMVYGNYYDDEFLLKEMEAKILNVNKISLKLHYKQHSTEIKVPPDFVSSGIVDYESTKDVFEKNHLKVGAFYIKEDAEHGINVMGRTQLNDTYEHMNCYNENGETKSFIDLWRKDETIRRKDSMNIYPKFCPPNAYNLWMPFRCETFTEEFTHQEEALKMHLNHVSVLCNHNKSVIDFVHTAHLDCSNDTIS